VVPHEGGRIYISVHDAEYLRQRAEWKRKLAEAHPDSPTGSAFAFRRLISQRAKWDDAEVQWYAQHGLTPPDTSTPKALDIPAHLLELAEGRQGMLSRRRVAAYLAEHPDATNQQIADGVGISRGAAEQSRRRLQTIGPTFTQPSRSQTLFRLLADGQPHATCVCLAAIGSGSLLGKAVRVLRNQGFDIVTERRGKTSSYRLVSAPHAR
jgi:hypothetical protein